MKTFLSAGLKTGLKIGLALGLTLTSLRALALRSAKRCKFVTI